MKSPIETRIRAGFGLALAIVAVLAVLSFRGTQSALEIDVGMARSQALMEHLDGVLIAQLDRDAAATGMERTDLAIGILAMIVLAIVAQVIVRGVRDTLAENAEALKAQLRGHASTLKAASTELTAAA